MVQIVNNDNLIKNLEINDLKKPGTLQYNGASEVLKAWAQWWKEFDAEAINDDESNNFLVLFNRTTSEIKALRSYGQHFLSPDMFLSSTPWIPVVGYKYMPSTECDLRNKLSYIRDLLDEFDKKLDPASNPVILLNHMGEDIYLAYSVNEKKKLFIYNYKAYRETFKFSYFSSPEDITENSNYKVYPFPREIIDAIGLRLYPPRWSFISPDSEWEYRAPRTRSQQDFGKFNSYYDKALRILNFLRTTPNNKNEENSRLEMRVSRFERLCELGAPKEIIAKEISLIINIVEELELELFPKNS